MDDRTAFVTSLNFIEAAQNRNIEAGVLVDPVRDQVAAPVRFAGGDGTSAAAAAGGLTPPMVHALLHGKLNPHRATSTESFLACFRTEDDEEDDESAETPRKGKRRSPPPEIRSDKPVLAVRVLVYDPKKQAASEPRIEFAALGDWRIGSDKAVASGPLNVGRTGLRRMARAIGAVGLAKDTPIGTGAVVKARGSLGRAGRAKGDSGLSCRLLLDGATVPLYEMDQPTRFTTSSKRIKEMWREANASST